MKAIRLSLILLAAALALIGCANPQVSTPGTPAGSVQGQALLVGKADNSGIVISAEPTDGIRSLSVQRALSGRSLGERAIAASTTTSASGSYTLSNLSPGTYVITASSKDSLEKAVTASVAVVAAQTTQVVTLCLTIPGQISGKAILSDAAAQANGSLGIVVFIAGTSFSAMTASDGTYLISGVPPGKNYTLVASKVGYDSAITTASVAVLQTTAVPALSLAKTITATATGSISGTALLSDGPPHSGVFVYLSGTAYMTTNTDSGSFSLAAVAPGTYSLKASKEGYDGAVTSVTVSAGSTSNISSPLSLTVIPKEVAAPTFSPSTGTFNTDQLVTIYDATQGASIYYTLDGTTPTTSSAVYSAPIPVAGNGTVTTITAIAAKAGMTMSAIAQCTISISYSTISSLGILAAPQFSHPAGSYPAPLTVSISTTPPGASVRYSTDGSMPTSSSGTLYTGPISLSATATLKAIAYSPGWTDSSISSAAYVLAAAPISPQILVPKMTFTAGTQGLTASVYAPGAVDYSWSIGDGGNGVITAGASTSTIVFTANSTPGTMMLMVAVTNAGGNAYTATKLISLVAPLSPGISVDRATVTANKQGLVANTAPGAATYSWRIISGGGMITSGASTSIITYIAANSPGTMVMQVAVTNAAGDTYTSTIPIIVVAALYPVISTESSVTAGRTGLTASVGSEGVSSYAWSISSSGSGAVTSGHSTDTMTYSANASPGTMTLKVVVTNAAGDQFIATTPITVVAQLYPVISVPSTTVTAGTTGNTAYVVAPGAIAYSWSMVPSGNGAIISATSGDEIVYAANSIASIMTLKVVVTNAAGDQFTATIDITVTVQNRQ